MRLSPDKRIYSMKAWNKPVVYCNCNDIITVETSDCYDGMVVSEIDEENNIIKSRINPATGPVFLNDAMPGDTMVVEIIDILLYNRGIMRISPEFGVLKEMVDKSKFKIIEITDGKIHFSDRIKLNVSPMIGVIGTSPASGEVDNETPGDHGGNMDTRNITIGSKVYLPVNVEGGLLAIGDIHAAMGDGEVSGTGAEVGGEITIKISMMKCTNQKRPYVETQNAIYTVCSAPTLEEASKLAVEDAVHIIMKKLDLSFDEAYMLASLQCNLMISQVVDPLMTARVEIPKCILNF